MKDIFKSGNKNRDIAFLLVFSVLVILVGYEIITNLAKIYSWMREFLSATVATLAPVLYGVVIAYLLYKPCNAMTDFFTNKTKFFAKRQRFARVLSVLSVNIIMLLLIALLLYAIIPNTVESIAQIASRAEEIVEPAQALYKTLSENETFIEILNLFNIDVNTVSAAQVVTTVLQYAQKALDSVGSYLIGFVVDMGTFLYNFIFGFIISIYVNLEKNELTNQSVRLIQALSGKAFPKLKELGHYSDKMFFGYLKGKVLTSAIIGLVAYIMCLILGVKYALLTGVILAVTNLIPIFGPWLGAIPCILFAILSGLKYAIYVAIIAILTQQLDNNIIGPRIIGENVNLNGFWVLVSIIVCGKLWGLMGMIIAIPLFAVLKKVVGEAVSLRLKRLNEKAEKPAAEPRKEAEL